MNGPVAVKRITAVEVDPGRSHQHEFNAGKLRLALGFGRGAVTGRLTAAYYGAEDDPEADVETGEYTLYDAREAHPTRTEYRLYYRIPAIMRRAHAGDLLILFRAPETNELNAVLARAGSDAEGRLLNAIFADDRPALDSFRVVTAPTPSGRQADALIAAMGPHTPIARTYGATSHPLVEVAIKAGKLPSTDAMAHVAQSLVRATHGAGLSADDQLDFALAAETELFHAINDELGERRLASLVAAKAGFAAIAAYVAGTKQSAKTRRGTSLQNHFKAVLDEARIPYRPQCSTESGETPDFVVPGHEQYHDPTYPASRLRMVACKSTSKERWRQVLNEARRIQEKYLLTLDSALSDDTVTAMNDAKVRPFLPRSVLDSSYATRPCRAQLRTVAELVAELRAVV